MSFPEGLLYLKLVFFSFTGGEAEGSDWICLAAGRGTGGGPGFRI